MKSFSKKEPKYKTNYEKKILKSVKNNIKRIKIFKKMESCFLFWWYGVPGRVISHLDFWFSIYSCAEQLDTYIYVGK